jgi:hypothetical protein
VDIADSPDFVYLVITVCIAVSALAFVAALYFTGKSKKDARRDIKIGLDEIYRVGNEMSQRIDSLDAKYIDSVGTLSQAANQNFSLAKQFLSLMERRVEKVNELVGTKRIEDLFKAHKIITSPLENAGDHLSSLVFSTTVLQLNPGDFELALKTMIDSVERELREGHIAKSYSTSGYTNQRRRKFTIRGFVQSITGEENKD